MTRPRYSSSRDRRIALHDCQSDSDADDAAPSELPNRSPHRTAAKHAAINRTIAPTSKADANLLCTVCGMTSTARWPTIPAMTAVPAFVNVATEKSFESRLIGNRRASASAMSQLSNDVYRMEYATPPRTRPTNKAHNEGELHRRHDIL